MKYRRVQGLQDRIEKNVLRSACIAKMKPENCLKQP